GYRCQRTVSICDPPHADLSGPSLRHRRSTAAGHRRQPVSPRVCPAQPPWSWPLPHCRTASSGAMGRLPGARSGARQPGPRPRQSACVSQRSTCRIDRQSAVCHCHCLAAGRRTKPHPPRTRRSVGHGAHLASDFSAPGPSARLYLCLANLCFTAESGRLL
ncbi:FIG00956435: hypothetical protein, partial [Pseudomonas fluorescens]